VARARNGKTASEQSRALMLSIRPDYAGRILDGEKSVELRRIRPNISKGDILVIYASLPKGAIVGRVEVRGLIEGHPTQLWKSVRGACGLSKREFTQYFTGAKKAYGIVVRRPMRSRNPLTLGEIRQILPNFHPPQGYKYLHSDRDQDQLLLKSSCS